MLSPRRSPALFALLLVFAALATACERNPAAAEEQQGNYCEENPENC